MTLVTSNTFDANGMVSGAGSDPQRKQTQGQYNKHHHQIKKAVLQITLSGLILTVQQLRTE